MFPTSPPQRKVLYAWKREHCCGYSTAHYPVSHDLPALRELFSPTPPHQKKVSPFQHCVVAPTVCSFQNVWMEWRFPEEGGFLMAWAISCLFTFFFSFFLWSLSWLPFPTLVNTDFSILLKIYTCWYYIPLIVLKLIIGISLSIRICS